jgi:hypothetical protein
MKAQAHTGKRLAAPLHAHNSLLPTAPKLAAVGGGFKSHGHTPLNSKGAQLHAQGHPFSGQFHSLRPSSRCCPPPTLPRAAGDENVQPHSSRAAAAEPMAPTSARGQGQNRGLESEYIKALQKQVQWLEMSQLIIWLY